MRLYKYFTLMLACLLIVPRPAPAQLDGGHWQVTVFEMVDPSGSRFATIVVPAKAGRGYEAGTEYWRCSEESLTAVAAMESLEINVLAEGEWNDPWVTEALGWQPADTAVEWNHPAEVEWTPVEVSQPPVVSNGTTFTHATLGALTIAYTPTGASSLTWFKFTEGAFMQLDDGAVFSRDEGTPEFGSWWFGPINQ